MLLYCEHLRREEEDLFLAIQLQEQEEFALQYEQEKKRSPSKKYEKVSTIDYRDSTLDIYFANDETYDDGDDVPEKYFEQDEDEHENPIQMSTSPGGRVSNKKFASSPSKSPEFKKDKKNQKVEVNLPTVDGLDGTSRVALFKLQNQNVLEKLGGCISQGKEALIYHAFGGNAKIPDVVLHPGAEYAVKVYKTTKVEFRDREKYIEGEWRFRYDTQSAVNSPKKMMKLWAEKEIRNLKRLRRCGIACPEPILQKGHILLLSFIGKEGFPAPQLEQVKVSQDEYQDLYWQCISMMRDMYQKGGIIHSDLSPYNLLVYKSKLHVIDLAQGVSPDHPSAMDFLRRDCSNMTKFFKSRGVERTASIRQLFEYVTCESITDESLLMNKMKNIQTRELTNEEQVEEQVWMNTTIPRSLKHLDPYSIKDDAHISIYNRSIQKPTFFQSN
eukprot:TRINITY_DN1016_c0_g1_i4.p1 TRINITY_DN1016_c0_g1~~TRINITY_DN1016_c0_g1_i4.p1  ORF type:complete len:442 (-),score=85.56 TRINITY_DN1016_c0_g1_i4:180-1505(-)